MGEELLKKASPRPWAWEECDGAYAIFSGPDSPEDDIGQVWTEASAALIVRAVNEREHLLRVRDAVAAALKNGVPHSTGVRIFAGDVDAIRDALKKVEEWL